MPTARGVAERVVDLACRKAADTNDDGKLNIIDPLALLLHVFRGRVIPPPFAACGLDPTADSLDCESCGPCP